MTVEGGEAAADVLTGAVVANALEPDAGGARSAGGEPRPACLNCAAELTGAYCASCGQSAHIHRSFRSLGLDILHSVFHFEGKFWRTIPELVFRPGQLTRRYIAGERAKFISPIALFLFTLFLMYGIFAFLPDMDWEDPPPFPELPRGPDRLEGFALGGDEGISDLSPGLIDVQLPSPPRVELSQEIPALEFPTQSSADVSVESARPPRAEETRAARESGAELPADEEDKSAERANVFTRAAAKLEENPDLVLYKMKSNGYKWSWLLVPLSIPFMWALFFWRREFPLYDHAIFVTYSISFMMILVITSTLAQLAGVGASVQAALLMLVPPLHLYKQLRGTYRLSRLGALVRLVFVLVAAGAVLSAFVTMLLLIGALE